MASMTTSALGEIVTTTDGRKIELNSNGTYQILDSAGSSSIAMTELAPFFQPFAGEYDQNSMRFMPIFKNETGKVVVGFRFKASFVSAFGDEIFSFDGESSERVGTSKSSTAETYYFFEDNPFIANEPYDKLKIFQAAGTGRVTTKVTAVVFDGGEVVKFSD